MKKKMLNLKGTVRNFCGFDGKYVTNMHFMLHKSMVGNLVTLGKDLDLLISNGVKFLQRDNKIEEDGIPPNCLRVLKEQRAKETPKRKLIKTELTMNGSAVLYHYGDRGVKWINYKYSELVEIFSAYIGKDTDFISLYNNGEVIGMVKALINMDITEAKAVIATKRIKVYAKCQIE